VFGEVSDVFFFLLATPVESQKSLRRYMLTRDVQAILAFLNREKEKERENSALWEHGAPARGSMLEETDKGEWSYCLGAIPLD